MAVDNGSTPESPPVENSAPTTESQSALAPSTDVTPAPSSSAKDESLLDRVKSALKPKTEGSSPSQAGQEAKPNSAAPSEDDEKEPDGDPTEEEQARYHSKTRKQVQRLLRQRNEALDEVKTLKPEAEVGRRITGFIQDAGMSADEANLLLDVGRNMKRDPLKALEQLKPYYDALTRMSGDVLPADLQAAVTKGEIAEPYARQLARSRTETSVLNQRTQAQDDQQRQRQVQERTQQHATQVGQTISSWEASQAKADPDWNMKQSRIGELIELDVRRNGYPKTAQAAVELAEKAKTQVNGEFARFAPRKLPVNSVNPASAARTALPAPTSALEAAKQRLAKAS
jgi:hypothetical protein